MHPPETHRLTSYGLDRSVTAWLLRPRSEAEVLECIDIARGKHLSICPVGGRNSFGDVFLLGDHVSVDLTRLNRIVSFDAESGTVTTEAGALDRDVLALTMPRGWVLPSLAGSLWNTMGGNLSSNVNGKDSWHRGAFGDQVTSFKMALADGSTRTVDRQGDAELFHAVAGGLGLLGIVTEITVQLQPIPSAILETSSRAEASAIDLVARFANLRPDEDDLAYAWIDPYANGPRLGRSVFESARFVADAAPLSTDSLRRNLTPRDRIGPVSPEVFWGVVSRAWKILEPAGLDATIFRALSALKYARARRAGEIRRRIPFPQFQYPMVNHFPQWNLKFAPEGFHEVHALFPTARYEAALRALLGYCRRLRHIPEVCAARRHRADDYPLSFSGDGISLTLPFPLGGFARGELEPFYAGLMEKILEFDGKVYLAKFPYMSVNVFKEMYPSYRAFLDVKQRVDPDRLFWSDAAGRLLG